jgi:hypothetical protein
MMDWSRHRSSDQLAWQSWEINIAAHFHNKMSSNAVPSGLPGEELFWELRRDFSSPSETASKPNHLVALFPNSRFQ